MSPKINLESIDNVYFLGAGGIGMSALVRYFLSLGKKVGGYDKTPSPLTEQLIKEGLEIHFEDLGSAIPSTFIDKEKTLVVYTPAIPKQLGELKFFQQTGFTILKRAEVLGVLTQNSTGLGVAGTHGKTTTSTLLAHILNESTQKCAAFLGGISSNFNTNFITAENAKFTVIEADEFDRSFLKLSPFASIITSTDADHLDIYGTAENLLKSFQEYADLTPENGILILKKGLKINAKAPIVSYALNEEADFEGSNLRYDSGEFFMDVKSKEGFFPAVKLGLPGIHNAENALACFALCHFLGLSETEIRHGLSTFKGVKRRFEFHVKSPKISYIDDYAHHPTEINAFLKSVRLLFPTQKIIGVFQPHLFSRTRDFMPEFAAALSELDELMLMPIYPAREEAIPGITSEVLLEMCDLKAKKICQPSEVLARMNQLESGIVVSIGAGDIDRLIPQITEIINQKIR